MENKNKITRRAIMIVMLLVTSLIPSGIIAFMPITSFVFIYLVIGIYVLLQGVLFFVICEGQINRLQSDLKAHVKKDRLMNHKMVLINNEDKLKNLLSLEIERLRLTKNVSSVLFFDVDELGKINERHGYEVGDQVLIDLIDTVKTLLNAEEYQIARIKGDTFAVLYFNQNTLAAYQLAEKLKDQIAVLETPFDLKISCRFAVVEINELTHCDKLIHIAYEKLKEAKNSGNGTIL